MTDTGREYAAFLRAIAADPDADLPRLAFADWLEENARPVACGRCGGEGLAGQHWDPASDTLRGGRTCPDCGGSGQTYPDLVRVRFIRHQFAGEPAIVPLTVLADAEAVLGVQPHQTQRSAGKGVCEVFVGGRLRLVYRRGFVDEWHGELAAWLGRACERCGGGGQRVGADRPFEYGPDAREALRCPDCSGTGYTGGVGVEVVRRHPMVRRVEVTDREPYYNGYGHSWFDEGRHRRPPAVPTVGELPAVAIRGLENLPDGKIRGVVGRFVSYATVAAARAALSAALVSLGRAWAGLPPLPVPRV